MKFSAHYKNKLLKKLLKSEINPKTYHVQDIDSFKRQIRFISNEELIHYLNILEWEHLIDIEFDEKENLKSICILPNAFPYRERCINEAIFKCISIIISLAALICTFAQLCHF